MSDLFGMSYIGYMLTIIPLNFMQGNMIVGGILLFVFLAFIEFIYYLHMKTIECQKEIAILTRKLNI